jgi:hypothetical protein
VRTEASPHSRLLRAIERGNLDLVRLAAAECERIDLETALRILLLIADQEPETFERAAVRWAGQLLAARPALGFEGARTALAGLEGLDSHERGVAASSLSLVLRGIGEVRAATAVEQGGRPPGHRLRACGQGAG